MYQFLIFCKKGKGDYYEKIAAAYIRVSTHMQEELSPDAQLRCIRDWGNVHGYYIPDEYVFIDNGISGRKAKSVMISCE